MTASLYLTVASPAGATGFVGSAVAVAFFAAEVVCAVELFAWTLPRRPIGLMGVCGLVTLLALLVGALLLSATVSYVLSLIAFSGVLVLCFALVLLLHDTSGWVALFCASAGYAMQNLASSANEQLLLALVEAKLDPSEPVLYWTCALVSVTVVYVLCYLLLVRKLNREGLSGIEDRSMLLVMALVSLVVIGFDLTIKAATGAGLAFVYVTLLRVFHCLACVFVLWLQYATLYRRRLEQDQADMERILAERQRQYQRSRENIEAVNIKCHDIRHQIRQLRGKGPSITDEAIDDLEREVSIYDSAVETGNEALDTILTEKSLVCDRQEISLTCVVDGSALGFLAPAELYALFGNALDNAIEATGAVESPKSRSISVIVRQTMGLVSVHVENTCVIAPTFVDGLPQTTKADRANHGFGMRSMRGLVERHGGTLTAACQDGTFSLDISLPAPQA